MLQGVKRLLSAERVRNRRLETKVREWLNTQILAPAPGRPREVTLGGRSCHINPCAVKVEGTEYVDLDIREKQGGKVIMTVRTRAGNGAYVTTLWR